MLALSWVPWTLFNLFIVVMLALDLGVFNRKSHTISFKEAVVWSAIWIGMAMLFNLWIFHSFGSEVGLQFMTGYVIEKSLSVDNLFVFLVIFSYFKVDSKHQHKVLFWGVVGAILMRAIFIFAGVALIEKFHWMIYLFGGILVVTGIKLALQKHGEQDMSNNAVVRWARKIIPMTKSYEGDRFFVKQGGKWLATPLFLVVLVVEQTDLVFAVDSIPAVLAITRDPFIVYTSNIFAILGLRSLYFALSGFMDMFHFLKYGLAAVLTFVGCKMIFVDVYKFPILLSLAVIFSLLLLSMIASVVWKPAKSHK